MQFASVEKFRSIPLSKRRQRSKFYLDKFPNRVPILLESRDKNLELKKFKFILP